MAHEWPAGTVVGFVVELFCIASEIRYNGALVLKITKKGLEEGNVFYFPFSGVPSPHNF